MQCYDVWRLSLITLLHPQELPLPGSGTTSMTSSTAERRDSVSGSVGSAPSSPATSRTSDGPSSLPAQPPAPYVNEAIRKYVSEASCVAFWTIAPCNVFPCCFFAWLHIIMDLALTIWDLIFVSAWNPLILPDISSAICLKLLHHCVYIYVSNYCLTHCACIVLVMFLLGFCFMWYRWLLSAWLLHVQSSP